MKQSEKYSPLNPPCVVNCVNASSKESKAKEMDCKGAYHLSGGNRLK